MLFVLFTDCKAVEEELDSIELPDIPDFEDLPDF